MRRVKIPRKLVQYPDVHSFIKCLGINCESSFENDDHYYLLTDSNLNSMIEDDKPSGKYNFEIVVSYFKQAKNYDEVVAKFIEDTGCPVSSVSWTPEFRENKKFFIGNCVRIRGEIDWDESMNSRKFGKKGGYGCGFIMLEKTTM